MAYRDDDDVLHDRLDALREETERLERTLRERGAAPRRLPLLDRVSVASPCKASWDAMIGDARERLCGACEKTVYNLSEMTRADAEAFLQERLGADGERAGGPAGGGVCVRLFRRADGTILTADCPVGVRTKVAKRRLVGAAGAGLLAAGALATSYRLARAERTLAPQVMGELVAAPPVEVGVVEAPLEMRMGDVAVEPAPAPAKTGAKR